MTDRRKFIKGIIGSVVCLVFPWKLLGKTEQTVTDPQSDHSRTDAWEWDGTTWRRTKWNQLLMKLHARGEISTDTFMRELQLNYNDEIKRIRYELEVASQGQSLRAFA